LGTTGVPSTTFKPKDNIYVFLELGIIDPDEVEIDENAYYYIDIPSTLIPSEDILITDEPDDLIIINGEVTAVGGVYKSDDGTYQFRVKFTNINNKIDIKATYQYSSYFSEELEKTGSGPKEFNFNDNTVSAYIKITEDKISKELKDSSYKDGIGTYKWEVNYTLSYIDDATKILKDELIPIINNKEGEYTELVNLLYDYITYNIEADDITCTTTNIISCNINDSYVTKTSKFTYTVTVDWDSYLTKAQEKGLLNKNNLIISDNKSLYISFKNKASIINHTEESDEVSIYVESNTEQAELSDTINNPSISKSCSNNKCTIKVNTGTKYTDSFTINDYLTLSNITYSSIDYSNLVIQVDGTVAYRDNEYQNGYTSENFELSKDDTIDTDLFLLTFYNDLTGGNKNITITYDLSFEITNESEVEDECSLITNVAYNEADFIKDDLILKAKNPIYANGVIDYKIEYGDMEIVKPADFDSRPYYDNYYYVNFPVSAEFSVLGSNNEDDYIFIGNSIFSPYTGDAEGSIVIHRYEKKLSSIVVTINGQVAYNEYSYLNGYNKDYFEISYDNIKFYPDKIGNSNVEVTYIVQARFGTRLSKDSAYYKNVGIVNQNIFFYKIGDCSNSERKTVEEKFDNPLYVDGCATKTSPYNNHYVITYSPSTQIGTYGIYDYYNNFKNYSNDIKNYYEPYAKVTNFYIYEEGKEIYHADSLEDLCADESACSFELTTNSGTLTFYNNPLNGYFHLQQFSFYPDLRIEYDLKFYSDKLDENETVNLEYTNICNYGYSLAGSDSDSCSITQNITLYGTGDGNLKKEYISSDNYESNYVVTGNLDNNFEYLEDHADIIVNDEGNKDAILNSLSINDLKVYIDNELAYDKLTNTYSNDYSSSDFKIEYTGDAEDKWLGFKITPLSDDLKSNKEEIKVEYTIKFDIDKFADSSLGDSIYFGISNVAWLGRDGEKYTSEETVNYFNYNFSIDVKKESVSSDDLNTSKYKLTINTGDIDREDLKIEDIPTLSSDFWDYLSISDMSITIDGVTKDISELDITDSNGDGFELNKNGLYSFIINLGDTKKDTEIVINYSLTIDKDKYKENIDIVNESLQIMNDLKVTTNKSEYSTSTKGYSMITDEFTKEYNLISSDNGNYDIDWSLNINLLDKYTKEDLSSFEDYNITDKLDNRLELKEDSLKVYKNNVVATGITKGEELVKDTDYTYTYEDNVLTVTILNPSINNQLSIEFETETKATIDSLSNYSELNVNGETTGTYSDIIMYLFNYYRAGTITSNNKALYNIEGLKYLDNSLSKEGFRFILEEIDSNGNVLSNGEKLIIENDNEGNIKFNSLSYKVAGTYYYQIREDDTYNNEEYNLDDKVYKLKVEVVESNGSYIISNAELEGASEIVFNNSTKPEEEKPPLVEEASEENPDTNNKLSTYIIILLSVIFIIGVAILNRKTITKFRV